VTWLQCPGGNLPTAEAKLMRVPPIALTRYRDRRKSDGQMRSICSDPATRAMGSPSSNSAPPTVQASPVTAF
jgi:hypothetical protein